MFEYKDPLDQIGLNLAPVSVRRLVARGVLPVCRLCRKLLFRRADILDLVRRFRTTPRDRDRLCR